jgi:hypothetical protein
LKNTEEKKQINESQFNTKNKKSQSPEKKPVDNNKTEENVVNKQNDIIKNNILDKITILKDENNENDEKIAESFS